MPTPSETTGPPVSPAPAGLTLTSAQKEQFDLAVDRYARFEDFTARVIANPKVTNDIALELGTYTLQPATKKWSDSLNTLIAANGRIEGRRKLEWTVPKSVTSNRIVFLQCESPGTWVAIKGDERGPQKNNSITEVSMAKVKQDPGNWRVVDQKQAGQC